VALRHITNIRRIVRGEEDRVVRPVRWKGRPGGPTAEEALAQGPAGADPNAPVWREPVEDPLKAEDPAKDGTR
jgi:hypothetical protein